MWQSFVSSDVEMKKICPICGKKYPEKDNFCSKHSNVVKLVNIKDLVKICPKCGEKYLEDDNFCGFHDEPVKLCFINELVKQCRGCGAKYPKEYNYCVRCEWNGPLEVIGRRDIDIKDIKTNPNKHYNFRIHSNHFNTPGELLSAKNIELLKEFNISQAHFDEIINNIIRTYKTILKEIIDNYYIDFDGISILEKMFLFSKSLVRTEHKAGGGDLGHYMFNEIFIDDRLEAALQITTIIHELSHFLFSEILEQIISILLDTDKTEIIEAYVYYILENEDFNYLIDEYCAHTVEGRFVVMGYNDYGSYKNVLRDFIIKYSEEHVDFANVIGNTFADYIKVIVESFIDDDLRSEITYEFSKLHNKKRYDSFVFETDETFEWSEFRKAIRFILTKNIDVNANNLEFNKKLWEYSLEFKKRNEGV